MPRNPRSEVFACHAYPEKATKCRVTSRAVLYGWYERRAFFNPSSASDSNVDAFDTNSFCGISDCVINSSANNAAVTSDEAL